MLAISLRYVGNQRALALQPLLQSYQPLTFLARACDGFHAER